MIGEDRPGLSRFGKHDTHTCLWREGWWVDIIHYVSHRYIIRSPLHLDYLLPSRRDGGEKCLFFCRYSCGKRGILELERTAWYYVKVAVWIEHLVRPSASFLGRRLLLLPPAAYYHKVDIVAAQIASLVESYIACASGI